MKVTEAQYVDLGLVAKSNHMYIVESFLSNPARLLMRLLV